jgi:hypothetical protein
LVNGRDKVWSRHEGLTEVKEWVIGKGLNTVMIEEPSMNPVEAVADRLLEQVNSVVSRVKIGIKSISTLLTEKTLQKNVVKVSNNYLFVLLCCRL